MEIETRQAALGAHFKGAAGRFGIKLWKPAEALREIKK
jgi:hypothetical protein